MESHKVPTSEVDGIPPMMSKMVVSCVEWMKGSTAAVVFEILQDLSVGNLGNSQLSLVTKSGGLFYLQYPPRVILVVSDASITLPPLHHH